MKSFRDMMIRAGGRLMSVRVDRAYPYATYEDVKEHTELYMDVTPFGKDRAANFSVVDSK